jgi:hypothetical protein
MEKTKLIIGNGQKVEVYDLGNKIYEVNGEYLPCHGHLLMTDEEARNLLKKLNKFGKGKKVKNSC